jgi:hypothetical protein
MKTKSKKILLGLGIALLGGFSVKAQVGLQNIIVEKYYQANAADVASAFATNGNAANPGLSVGSITYRFFVDMAPGWRFNSLYGNAAHRLLITSSTAFYNDPNNFAVIGAQGTPSNTARANTRMIDSYLTCGGAMTGKAGVLKTQDTDGSIGNSLTTVLANTLGGLFGAPIHSINPGAADGLMPGTTGALGNILAPTALGFAPASDAFDFNAGGSTFSVSGGAMSALGGILGTNTANCVFIGQVTTDGVLGFELNVQVQNTVTAIVENWVANTPAFGEFTLGALTLAPPSVGITSPANNANIITGNVVAITATATSPGTVTSVDFRVDGISVGVDLTSPFAANYTATVGQHTITAIATDNNTLTTTSSPVIINVATNQAPVVTVASPANALIGSVVTLTANATDADGTVTAVSFSYAGVQVGTVAVNNPTVTATFTVLTVSGVQPVRAGATDDQGAIGLSNFATLNGVANIVPVVTINSPANNASLLGSNIVTITATATDADGTVTSVQAFINNTLSIGTINNAGPNYTFTWTPTIFGNLPLTLIATDNSAGTGTSTAWNLSIVNPTAQPYALGVVQQECDLGNFCMPINSSATGSVSNVIGYDIVLQYNPSKVIPTGSVSVNNAFIFPTPSGTTQVVDIFTLTTVVSPTVAFMNISASFKTTAPINSRFQGANAEIFCVGFTKTSTMTAVDIANFSVQSLQESYFTTVLPQLASSGSYITYKDSVFTGKLRFANNAIMPYSAANPTLHLVTTIRGASGTGTNVVATPNATSGVIVNSFAPDLTGEFNYNTKFGNTFDITRDIAAFTPVQPAINSADQSIGQAVILSNTSFTATGFNGFPTIYQIVALDVNLDGFVSSGDLTQMNLRSVDAIPEYKQAWNYDNAGNNPSGQPSKDYVFIDSVRIQTSPAYSISSTYPNDDGVSFSKGRVPVTPFVLVVPQSSLTANCPSIDNETFRGIMLGDANGSAAAFSGVNTGTNAFRSSSNGDKVVIDLARAIVNGDNVEVPVTFVSSNPVLGLDFAMKFDESNLTYNSIVNYPSTTNALAFLNSNSKTLRFTCTNSNLSAFTPNQPVASIRFAAKNGIIDENQFNSLVGYLNGEVVAIEVSSKTVGINSLGNNNSVSVYPNPTNGILNITSYSDANVQILDITGKEVLLQTTVNASKTQQINVSDLVNGVYILKVYNNDFVSIKKVVLNK